MIEEKVLYEIGYKLVPTLTEETLATLVGDLSANVETLGGAVAYSEMPKLRDLEYVVSKSIDRKRSEFSQAYFGWIRFELSPTKVGELKKIFAVNPSVIRSLIVREPASMLLPVSRRAPRPRRAPRDEKEAAPEVTKEMEKEIDALIASTEEKK